MAKMSSEEQRRLLKEQYKQDLKKRKEFLKDVEKYKRSKKLNDAVQNITAGLVNDDSDDWIEKLNQDSALTEAKMEMALDEASERQKMLEQLAKEAEMEKIEALNMVEEMKRQMGLISEDKPKEEQKPEKEEKVTSEDNAPEESLSNEDSNDDDPKPPFKKTMGDF